MRRLLLLAVALCGFAHAAPPPIDLQASPAWKGWSRPGRSTEVEIRLTAAAATRATLELVAGAQSVHAEVDLEPAKAVRLHVPVGPAERIAVSVRSPAGPPQQRDIRLAQSESPLLGVAVATGEAIRLPGFNAVALAPADLPRNASAYASVDALMLDSATLAALDRRQLTALLGHAAACGRIAVLAGDAQLRRLLQDAAGCGDRALLLADSPTQARQMLASSLAVALPAATSPGGIGGLARPGLGVWNRVAAMLAAYFAAAALAALWWSPWPVLVSVVPAAATVAVVALLHALEAPSQLVVWGEGEPGARVARYQAWQRFPGVVRERTRRPIPAQLAAAARPCEPDQAMRFDLHAGQERPASVEFDTRLFGQVSLCYSGSFPMARAIEVETRPDRSRRVRNAGPMAWPEGLLLADGLMHDLPALGAGAVATLGANTGSPRRDALARTALMRTPPDGAAALWPLELAGVVDATIESRGWLLVPAMAQ